MENKKGPLIAVWIAIAVLSINQMLNVRHGYLVHQQIQNQIEVLREDVLDLYQYDTDILRKMNDLIELFQEFEYGRSERTTENTERWEETSTN